MQIVTYRFAEINETCQIKKYVDVNKQEFLMVRFSSKHWVPAEEYPQFDFWQIWHEFVEEQT